MEVKNCPRCGKVFTMIKDAVCPNCIKAEEDTFHQLKDYINDNSNCTLQELSDGTGVTTKKILQYIRDGRLEISKGMHGTLKCDGCGKPIVRGRYCDTCVITIDRSVKEMFGRDNSGLKKEDKNKGLKMHGALKRDM